MDATASSLHIESTDSLMCYMCQNTQHTTITQIGLSPLQLAAGIGWTDIVVELVKNGANLNLQNEVCHDIQ